MYECLYEIMRNYASLHRDSEIECNIALLKI